MCTSVWISDQCTNTARDTLHLRDISLISIRPQNFQFRDEPDKQTSNVRRRRGYLFKGPHIRSYLVLCGACVRYLVVESVNMHDHTARAYKIPFQIQFYNPFHTIHA